MRSILCLFILLPSCFFSQNRNHNVIVLNEIVELMNRSSKLNLEYYNRSTEFCGNLCGKYKPEEWVSQAVRKEPLYNFFGRKDTITPKQLTHKTFKELQPDEQNQVYSYEGDVVPYLLQREKIKEIIKSTETTISTGVRTTLLKFTGVVDELISSHYEMRSYTHTKQQFKDPNFKTAKSISKKFNNILEKYRIALNLLWNSIEKDYAQNFQPFKTQQPVIMAEKELAESVKLVYAWAEDKFNNISTKDSFHITAILSNISSALERGPGYLQNTYGYQDTSISRIGQYSSYIQRPELQYKNFYETLYSIATTNVSSLNLDFNRSDPSKSQYNNKVIHFNKAVDAYNNFILWADGKKILTIMKNYYKEHLYTEGLDTNVNVMLKKPYLPSYFDCLCVSENPSNIIQKKDSVSNKALLVALNTTINHQYKDSVAIDKALPHHLVYLLDASSSMNEFDRLNILKTNARYLVNLQRKVDRLSIVSFASTAHIIIHNKPCDQKSEIHHKIDQIEAQGSSNIDAGVLKAFEIADSCRIKDGKTKLLLITDGLFKLSKQSLRLIKSLSSQGIDFCIIYIGNSQNSHLEEQFKKISDLAKGRFYSIRTNDLKEILIKEASE